MTRLEALEKIAALIWDAQDIMNDGPDDSDIAMAHGRMKEAANLSRQVKRGEFE